MSAGEDHTPDPGPRSTEGRLLVTDEVGKVRPVVVWLLASMAFTAVAVLLGWHPGLAVGGGAGVVVGWVLLALERKRQRAASEARDDDEDDGDDEQAPRG